MGRIVSASTRGEARGTQTTLSFDGETERLDGGKGGQQVQGRGEGGMAALFWLRAIEAIDHVPLKTCLFFSRWRTVRSPTLYVEAYNRGLQRFGVHRGG